MIEKFETVTVNKLVRTNDANGEAVITPTVWFTSVAKVDDIANLLKVQDQYRLYTSFGSLGLQYTPNTFAIAMDNSGYSFTWRGISWRIMDAVENARRSIRFLVYDATPGVTV